MPRNHACRMTAANVLECEMGSRGSFWGAEETIEFSIHFSMVLSSGTVGLSINVVFESCGARIDTIEP